MGGVDETGTTGKIFELGRMRNLEDLYMIAHGFFPSILFFLQGLSPFVIIPFLE